MKHFDTIYRRPIQRAAEIIASPPVRRARKSMRKPFIGFLIVTMLFMIFPFPQSMKKILPAATKAQAQYQYTATAGQINGGKGTTAANDYYSTRSADGSYWMISPVAPAGAHSLDAQVTISGVDLRNANKIILSYRLQTSTTSLHYVFSIYDNVAGIWRPLNNHTAFNPADAGNLTNFYSAELTPAAALTYYSYQFEIFNGYFANTTSSPGTAINTPLSNFVSSNNLLMRVSSQNDPGANTWYLNWDYAQAEVAVDPGYAPSAATVSTGTPSRYYSDLFTQDVNDGSSTITATNFTTASSGNSVDEYFTISNITIPYSMANTILIDTTVASSVASISSLNMYIWNYNSGSWETSPLNLANGTPTSPNYNKLLAFSAPTLNHISGGGEIKLRLLASHSVSFNLYVDWVKVVIGSTATSATYQNNISVGTTASGANTATSDLDNTSTSPNSWIIAASNDYTQQYNGDTNSTYSVAMNMSVPMSKPPAGSMITGMQLATKIVPSASNPPRFNLSLRDYSAGWTTIVNNIAPSGALMPGGDANNLSAYGTTYCYPVVGAYYSGTNVILGTSPVNPENMLDTTNNLANLRLSTSTGNSSIFTVAVDFVFLSGRYIQQEEEFRTQFVPDFGVKNVGGAETNTWRYGMVNDAAYWTVNNTGVAPGVDVMYEFRGVALPTTYNRLILYAKYSWSVASTTHAILIYDWTNSVWRNVSPHAANPTDYMLLASSTGSTQQYYQFDIFNGYFRDPSVASPGSALNTPLTNFIGTGANAGKVQMRIVQGGTSGNLIFDWAQLEIANDTTYYPTSVTHNVGTSPAGYYNDLYTPDNSAGSGTLSNNESAAITKATSGTDRLDTRFDFANVSTPYTGANALLVDFQNAISVNTDTTALVQIYNLNTSSWESINGAGLTSGSLTAGRYYRYQFIKNVTTWSNYIDAGSSNTIHLRCYSNGTTAATYYFDYARITVGSVTTPSDTGNIDYGQNYLNDKSATANLDTTLKPSLNANMSNAWYLLNQPQSGTYRAMEAPTNLAARVDFDVTKPANSNVTGVKFAAEADPGSSFGFITEFRDIAGNYTSMYASTLNFQFTGWSGASATGVGQGVAPGAADTSQFTTGSGMIFISGNYQTTHHSVLDTLNNKITLALRPRSNYLAESIVVVDMMFVSIRYVVP